MNLKNPSKQPAQKHTICDLWIQNTSATETQVRNSRRRKSFTLMGFPSLIKVCLGRWPDRVSCWCFVLFSRLRWFL